MKPPVGIALVGCGRIATSHLDAIRALPEFGRLVAVVDTDVTRAREFAARYAAIHVCTDLQAALSLDEVEAVCICTPNELHSEQALAAMAAGRHVLVEKPFAESVAVAVQLQQAAERREVILAAGHTFRHSAAVRYILDHRSEFGRLRAVQISACVSWDGPQAPWWADLTPEQGLILNLLAPHPLDFLQLAMGEDDPVRLTVETARVQSGWQAEDEAMILLRYPEDRMAFVHLSYNQSFVTDRKTLHFERALLRIEDGDSLWVDDRLVVRDPAPAAEPHRMGARDLSHYFRNQFEEFVRAIRGEPSRSVTPREAVRLTALTHRILDAARSSRVTSAGAGAGAQTKAS